ncbi:MAG: TRAP transporter small permease subunit [Rhodopseudomonas sp.]|nr:TRAP transporter small permease subunit [Rhodopseudomonas sp.]
MSTGHPEAAPRRGPFGFLAEGLGAIGTIWIFFLMLLINADVAGRYFFDKPLVGTVEIVSMSIVGIIYLQLGHALRYERFIRSDGLLGRLLLNRPRIGYAVQGFHHLVGAVLLALMVYFCVPETINAWQQSEYLGTEGVFVFYIWPINALVTLGAAVTAIQFFLHFLRDLRVAAGLLAPPVPLASDVDAVV